MARPPENHTQRQKSAATAAVWLLAVAGALCFGTAQPAWAQQHPRSPNFVLILADDQGWTGTSVRMDEDMPNSKSDFYLTPNLERLAEQGMRFSAAYAPAPNCSPTRASIQTGKSPAQLHMTDIIGSQPGTGRYKRFYQGLPLLPPVPRAGLPHEAITIAEFLNAAKPQYVTAHLGKWHLGAGGPEEHGYEVSGGSRAWEGRGLKASNPKDTFGLSRRAMTFMENQVEAGHPFFLQISYFAVHRPIDALEKTIEKYKHIAPGRRHDHVGYAAMTENLDAGVGMVLDKIDELGIADNTYVIYFSDNGAIPPVAGSITNNDPLSHGKTKLWEGGIRVPMIVRGPGIKPGSQCDVPVIGWDFFPTIADLAGIEKPLPQGVEGGSLVQLLKNGGEGTVQRPREALVWHFPHYQLGKNTTPHSAIRVGDYKLIKVYETGKLYLYHITQDIGEDRNLVLEMPDKAKRMEQRLMTYLQKVGAEMPRPNPEYEPESNRGL